MLKKVFQLFDKHQPKKEANPISRRKLISSLFGVTIVGSAFKYSETEPTTTTTENAKTGYGSGAYGG
jgi:hypothetical protein